MVHAYFAWRIKIVTRNIWIPAFIMAAAVISCYGGLATAVSVQASKSYAKLDRFDPNVAIWLISTAICDTIIAVTLTWHMKTQSDLSMDDRFEQLTKRSYNAKWSSYCGLVNCGSRCVPGGDSAERRNANTLAVKVRR
ncbi:hypothetical protein EW026_g7604 [Hermanssonia centrifuga]|uniref:Uncharacterized protein n=1 Tax=Hermanssonia centrifuga TaxID=98765 RepID=A0A4S4K8A2_9APHY|nr:hypothetical protein EW026_g7604 [Hermanssonia centrifuga]